MASGNPMVGSGLAEWPPIPSVTDSSPWEETEDVAAGGFPPSPSLPPHEEGKTSLFHPTGPWGKPTCEIKSPVIP